MTYWSNPLIECRWTWQPDPLPDILKDQFKLFWNPRFDFSHLHTNQRLADLCAWANTGLAQGLEQFVNDSGNHYDIANLVKLNMWAEDIHRQGIVKPWLILDWGDHQEAGTGDSRMRLCEIMPDIRTVPAFISTHRSRANLYQGLDAITDFDQFARFCGAEVGQKFLFRPTDDQAPFGIYWYEYDSGRTRSVTPGEAWCVAVFARYYEAEASSITPDWFLAPIDWHSYAGTVQ